VWLKTADGSWITELRPGMYIRLGVEAHAVYGEVYTITLPDNVTVLGVEAAKATPPMVLQ
jgi:hypothetical protein